MAHECLSLDQGHDGTLATGRAMTYRFGVDEEEAEERGHRKIHCSRCGYRGWSEDTGWCPNCPLETDEATEEEETP